MKATWSSFEMENKRNITSGKEFETWTCTVKYDLLFVNSKQLETSGNEKRNKKLDEERLKFFV